MRRPNVFLLQIFSFSFLLTSLGQIFSFSKYFPFSNRFLRFLHCSFSPPWTKYFDSPNILFLQIFRPFPVRRQYPLVKYFLPFFICSSLPGHLKSSTFMFLSSTRSLCSGWSSQVDFQTHNIRNSNGNLSASDRLDHDS